MNVEYMLYSFSLKTSYRPDYISVISVHWQPVSAANNFSFISHYFCILQSLGGKKNTVDRGKCSAAGLHIALSRKLTQKILKNFSVRYENIPPTNPICINKDTEMKAIS